MATAHGIVLRQTKSEAQRDSAEMAQLTSTENILIVEDALVVSK